MGTVVFLLFLMVYAVIAAGFIRVFVRRRQPGAQSIQILNPITLMVERDADKVGVHGLLADRFQEGHHAEQVQRPLPKPGDQR